jgi:signal transduction histidine kinase/CheY-like chemotaxis protein
MKVLTLIKNSLLYFFTSGRMEYIHDEAAIDEMVRLIIINLTYTGVSVLIIIMGVNNMRSSMVNTGLLFLIIGFLIFINIFLLRTELPFIVGGTIVISLFGIFCTMQFFTDDKTSNFNWIWIYSYPLMSIFTLGLPLGLLPAIALFGVLISLVFLPETPDLFHNQEHIVLACVIYLFIMSLTAVYEWVKRMKDKWVQQLTADLKSASQKAEQSNLAKSNFLSKMSHEMRTPMNAIIGMTMIAKSAVDKEKVDYCFSKINEASVHLLGVINDILDMSKIEAGKFEISYSEFNFKKMINRVADMMNFRISERKQNLKILLDSNIPTIIKSDEQRLAQVFVNLLSNANKFTPEGGTITLSVDILEIDGQKYSMRIAVTDTGIGISQEQQDRLFVSFEQADGSIARKYGGTGLGLVICKTIIESMGGKIWIESELGKGSAFIFEIKVEVNLDADESVMEDYEDDATDINERDIFSGHTILLAEDVEINREIIINVLEYTAITIECAENGLEAVKMFRNAPSKYSLILMDIQMPEMDGIEASRQIRTSHLQESESIPILAMTANVFQEDIERCLAAGMNAHLRKPIELTELVKKLKQYLKV